MSIDLRQFCEFFYSSHYVPVSLFDGGLVEATYSSLDKPLHILDALDSNIFSSGKNPDIFSLPELGQYGLIHVNGTDKSILLGPTFSSPITQDAVLSFARRNFIDSSDTELLTDFLNSIPQYTYNRFLSLVAFLHFCLNHEVFDVFAHFSVGASPQKQLLTATHTENVFAAKELEQQHDTFHFENTMLSFVRDGEVEKLNHFLLETVKTTELREGTLADTPLRQAKNLLIGGVTMVGKVGGVGGGMEVEEAYRLIDLYIQECEKASSVDAVKLLQYNMLLDFTERVAQSKLPKNTSKDVAACVQFIQNHTNAAIGIDDLATHIGKSRAHITKKFKQETGSSIGQFIVKSKLTDAKRLLRYSEKSLAEISNYLCFSSQGYFQTVFKKETGMTPGEYRSTHNAQ